MLGTYAAGRASFRFRDEVEGRYDLILAANVLAELPDARELRALLDRSLEPAGRFVLVEPALKESAERVQAWRDELVAAGWRVEAPCMGAARCPMRSQSELWCHQDIAWERPSFVSEIDRRLGLDKESLQFSYLIVTKAPAPAPTGWRVVSNPHRAKGRVWMSLCGRGPELVRAELLTRHRSEKTADFEHARRGDVLEIAPEPAGRLDEHVTVKRT
jgi:ribosomal protein RSM22 (predicted rRNA methylase)